MKHLIPLLFMLIAFSEAQAAIDPVYKECLQRGYAIEGDSCLMPDGSKCFLQDFNRGACGDSFFAQPYCVPQGNYVWDSDKCCKGLTAFLPSGMAGQETCRPKNKVFLYQISRHPGFWLVLLMIGITGLWLILRGKKKSDPA
jgi:hypothetical protein